MKRRHQHPLGARLQIRSAAEPQAANAAAQAVIAEVKDGYSELRDRYSEARDGYSGPRDVYSQQPNVISEPRPSFRLYAAVWYANIPPWE